MKVKDVITELHNYDPELEVRIMDVTKEEVDDETFCPTFNFDVCWMEREDNMTSQNFIALQFIPNK